jgi:UTP--glucose-1-phosphate uridylyltransferase
MGAIRTSKPEDADKYGFAEGVEIEPGIIKADEMIEKPGAGNCPSDLALVSGFVFLPSIFAALENFPVKEGKELVWLDGVNVLKEQGVPAYAVEIRDGKYYDCGDIMEYMKTNVELALKRDEYKEEFGEFIKDIAEGIV